MNELERYVKMSLVIGRHPKLGTHEQRVEYLKRLGLQARWRRPNCVSDVLPNKYARHGLRICLKLSGFDSDIKQYFRPLSAVASQRNCRIDRTHGRLS